MNFRKDHFWYSLSRLLLLSMVALFHSNCNTKKGILYDPEINIMQPRKLAVFLDGTSDNEESYTNISKLYNLVSLQNRPEVGAIYLRGVGNGADVVGMVLGSGIRTEVCRAYLYLSENYDHKRGDEIYLFGFSRGAYAARILAGFIHSAGIVKLDHLPQKERLPFVKKMFNAHKGSKSLAQRRADVMEISGQQLDIDSYKIEFMGLWDTVASLGLPDYEDNYYVPKTKFLDQLCNVKRASQALSLNDNRGSVFTPALLTHSSLTNDCSQLDHRDLVNEVWFFGTHSDVGGGYQNTYISGVSLNWMLDEIRDYNLLPENASVYENYLDKTNDPRRGIFKLFYPNKSRKLVYFTSRQNYRDRKLKIHKSVLDRLEYMVKTNEITLLEFFGECFDKNDRGGYSYVEGADCFEVIE